MNVFADITGVRISMCLYITTKVSGVHGVMYMVNTTVNTVINGIKNVYDKYGGYKPIRGIGTCVVGKVQKGIRYTYNLHKVS